MIALHLLHRLVVPAALALSGATAATAQTGDPAAELSRIAAAANGEWLTTLNCSRLNDDQFAVMRDIWLETLADGAAALQEMQVDPALGQAFLDDLALDRMLLPLDTSLGDLLLLCGGRQWDRPVNLHAHYRLDTAITEAFSQ